MKTIKCGDWVYDTRQIQSITISQGVATLIFPNKNIRVTTDGCAKISEFLMDKSQDHLDIDGWVVR